MEEQIIIVDEKDRIIGYRNRKTLSDNMIYRVAALWLTNSKGEILLAKRALTKKHNPGQWGPAAAGTVAKGETYISNIIKEAYEEIGLKITNPKKGPKVRVKVIHDHFTQWYTSCVDKDLSEFSIDRTEVAEIRWFKLAELIKELKNNPSKYLENMKKYLELFSG
jgi:isopentenyl-diphosphate Delta-isomerase